MVRGACGGVNHVEFRQTRIPERSDRVQMSNGGHAADGEPRLGADQGGVGLSQGFAGNSAGFGWVHLVAACGDEQDRGAAVLTTKDDRFGDLVNLTACCVGGLLRGAGFIGHVHRRDVVTCVV